MKTFKLFEKYRIYALFLLSTIVVILLVIFGVLSTLKQNKLKDQIKDLRISNLTENSVSISWSTNDAMYGEVEYSKDNNWLPLIGGKRIEVDDRKKELVEEEWRKGEYDKYYVHHVTLKDLEPETNYYFKLRGKGVSVKTEESKITTKIIREEMTAPNPIYGSVVDETGEDILVNAVVYINDNNDLKSVITNDRGKWTADVSTKDKDIEFEALAEPYGVGKKTIKTEELNKEVVLEVTIREEENQDESLNMTLLSDINAQEVEILKKGSQGGGVLGFVCCQNAQNYLSNTDVNVFYNSCTTSPYNIKREDYETIIKDDENVVCEKKVDRICCLDPAKGGTPEIRTEKCDPMYPIESQTHVPWNVDGVYQCVGRNEVSLGFYPGEKYCVSEIDYRDTVSKDVQNWNECWEWCSRSMRENQICNLFNTTCKIEENVSDDQNRLVTFAEACTWRETVNGTSRNGVYGQIKDFDTKVFDYNKKCCLNPQYSTVNLKESCSNNEVESSEYQSQIVVDENFNGEYQCVLKKDLAFGFYPGARAIVNYSVIISQNTQNNWEECWDYCKENLKPGQYCDYSSSQVCSIQERVYKDEPYIFENTNFDFNRKSATYEHLNKMCCQKGDSGSVVLSTNECGIGYTDVSDKYIESSEQTGVCIEKKYSDEQFVCCKNTSGNVKAMKKCDESYSNNSYPLHATDMTVVKNQDGSVECVSPNSDIFPKGEAVKSTFIEWVKYEEEGPNKGKDRQDCAVFRRQIGTRVIDFIWPTDTTRIPSTDYRVCRPENQTVGSFGIEGLACQDGEVDDFYICTGETVGNENFDSEKYQCRYDINTEKNIVNYVSKYNIKNDFGSAYCNNNSEESFQTGRIQQIQGKFSIDNVCPPTNSNDKYSDYKYRVLRYVNVCSNTEEPTFTSINNQNTCLQSYIYKDIDDDWKQISKKEVCSGAENICFDHDSTVYFNLMSDTNYCTFEKNPNKDEYYCPPNSDNLSLTEMAEDKNGVKFCYSPETDCMVNGIYFDSKTGKWNTEQLFSIFPNVGLAAEQESRADDKECRFDPNINFSDIEIQNEVLRYISNTLRQEERDNSVLIATQTGDYVDLKKVQDFRSKGTFNVKMGFTNSEFEIIQKIQSRILEHSNVEDENTSSPEPEETTEISDFNSCTKEYTLMKQNRNMAYGSIEGKNVIVSDGLDIYSPDGEKNFEGLIWRLLSSACYKQLFESYPENMFNLIYSIGWTYGDVFLDGMEVNNDTTETFSSYFDEFISRSTPINDIGASGQLFISKGVILNLETTLAQDSYSSAFNSDGTFKDYRCRIVRDILWGGFLDIDCRNSQKLTLEEFKNNIYDQQTDRFVPKQEWFMKYAGMKIGYCLNDKTYGVSNNTGFNAQTYYESNLFTYGKLAECSNWCKINIKEKQICEFNKLDSNTGECVISELKNNQSCNFVSEDGDSYIATYNELMSGKPDAGRVEGMSTINPSVLGLSDDTTTKNKTLKIPDLVLTYEDLGLTPPETKSVSEMQVDTGVYEIKSDTGDKRTYELIDEGNDKATIKFFADLNGNGIKEDDEPLVSVEEDKIEIKKIIDVMTYKLPVGWSTLNFPIELKSEEKVTKASELMKKLNINGANVEDIAAYRSGRWIIYSEKEGESGSSDFYVNPGEGYFVKNGREVVVTLKGGRIENHVTMELSEGWNLIGTVNKDLTASTLIGKGEEQGTTIDVVSKWDSGNYYNYVKEDKQTYGEDFRVLDNRGYFVRSGKYNKEFKI